MTAPAQTDTQPEARFGTEPGTQSGTIDRRDGLPYEEFVREYAEKQGVTEQEALAKGMQEKAQEFVESGAEIYRKA